MNIAALLLSPSGRISRGPFWIGFAVVMIGSTAANFIPAPIGQIAGLAFLWPQLAIHIKRLHDMGWSAWILLAPFAVTLLFMGGSAMLGGAAIGAAKGSVPAYALFGCAMAVGLGFLLWVGLTRGDEGANRFGPAPDAAAVAA